MIGLLVLLAFNDFIDEEKLCFIFYEFEDLNSFLLALGPYAVPSFRPKIRLVHHFCPEWNEIVLLHYTNNECLFVQW
jgi:hypothetical protein